MLHLTVIAPTSGGLCIESEHREIQIDMLESDTGISVIPIKDLTRIAHLLAAAPDMYEALKYFLDMNLKLDPATVPVNGIDAAPEQVVYNAAIGYLRIKKALYAIGKAEGSLDANNGSVSS